MQTALDAFNEAMRHVYAMHGLHHSLSAQLTAVVDLSDMLRAEIVLSVSAFDFYIHELTRLGMIECHNNTRPHTTSFKKFPVTLESAMTMTAVALDTEIRQRHGYLSFQSPEKVADAVRLFSNVELWNSVATELGIPAKEVKERLSLVIDRRNKIAHEADLDPSYPNQRWPIDRTQVEYSCDLLEKITQAIFKVAA